MNKMKNNSRISELVIKVFQDNWNEIFVFDSLSDRRVTYGEFFGIICQLKDVLKLKGVVPGDKICFLLPNSLELCSLYFSCLLAGAVAVPIDPNKGEDGINEVLFEADYKFLIAAGEFSALDRMVNVDEFKQCFVGIKGSDKDQLQIFNDIDYQKLFLITFTSGSTGVAKGVMHSFSNLVLSAESFRERFHFSGKNVFYHNLPMSYMAGILNLFVLPFISGSKVVLSEAFNVNHAMNFWDKPIRYQVNTFWFVPTIVSLLNRIDRGTNGIEYAKKNPITACIGTAPLYGDVRREFEQKYHIALYESYGLSETLFVSTNYPKAVTATSSVGPRLNGVELIFDSDAEILINVPWMFLGYSNISSVEYFKGKSYCSGDLGVEEDGFLLITGRKKDLIIRGGVNISPRKIEDFLGSCRIFEEYVVLGLQDPTLGEKIVCFYVAKDGGFDQMKKKEINSLIIQKWGRSYCIDEFISLAQVPKNRNGKVDKIAIKQNYQSVKK